MLVSEFLNSIGNTILLGDDFICIAMEYHNIPTLTYTAAAILKNYSFTLSFLQFTTVVNQLAGSYNNESNTLQIRLELA